MILEPNEFSYGKANPVFFVDPTGLVTLGIGGSVFNFSDCCVLVSQNGPGGVGQQQEWIRPGESIVGVFTGQDVDAIYFNNGRALKFPDSSVVAIWSCSQLADPKKVIRVPPNLLRPGIFRSEVLPDRSAQENEFGGSILPPSPDCDCP